MTDYAGPVETFVIELPPEYGQIFGSSDIRERARMPRGALAALMREKGHPEMYRTLMTDFDRGTVKVSVVH